VTAVIRQIPLAVILACSVCCAQTARPQEHWAAYGLAADDLSVLSDQQLVELYVDAYHQTLRQDVLDEASLVESGRCLFQVGYTFRSDNAQELGYHRVQHTLPELLLRYRLFPRLEVRVAWAGATFDRLSDEITGLADWESRLANPAVGGRLGLWDQRGWLPRMSLTVSAPFDLDSDAKLVNRLDPLASAGYSWLWQDRWLLSGNSGAVWTREGDERFLDLQQSLSLSWLADDRWGAELTWSGLFPEGARIDGISHTLGPGFSYSPAKTTQLDFLFAFGLDEHSPDFVTQILLSRSF